MELEQVKQEVKNILSEKRYYHSLCVMNQCEELAKQYEVNINKAKLVGIAHDIAKEMTEEEKMKYAKENKIIIDEIEINNKGLLHAKIGANIVKKRFGFDEEMTKAILAHTTGIKNMNLLAKILFISDSISEDRKWKDKEELKQLAMKDINKAIIYNLDEIIKENIKKGKQIHPNSINARNELLIL